ncbi:MAG: MazG nucleotide pyrophosphohydrolase domain-containing protein [Candidatus Thorarchaeota archaeon]|jgi:NTP pyrophosphatase (non-canonical NTP hydrolase)
MDTKDAQDLMRRIYLERDKRNGVEGVLFRTFEELEELRVAILENKDGDSIEEEVADVFAWLCSLANLLNIDLSDALIKKYPNACSRCGKAPCQCRQ